MTGIKIGHRTIRLSVAIAGGILVAAQSWVTRHHLFPDGASYLDLGRLLVAGDWSAGVNGYWSPLYALLLGLTEVILKPTPSEMVPAIHALGFLLYLLATLAFDRFLVELVRFRRERSLDETTRPFIPEWGFILVLALCHQWTMLELCPQTKTTPDLIVVAVLHGAAALLTRSARIGLPPSRALALGAILGIGYLAKTAVFGLGVVTILIAALVMRGKGRQLRAATIGMTTMVLVTSLWAVPLSIDKGRLTLGDVGKISYAWYVRELPASFWEGGPVGAGSPVHAPKRLNGTPAVYLYDPDWPVSDASFHDPSHWFEGLEPDWSLSEQVRAWKRNLRGSWPIINPLQRWPLALAGLLLLLRALTGHRHLSPRGWFLLPVALIALGAYLSIILQGRYVPALVVQLWATGLLALDGPRPERFRQAPTILVAALALAWGHRLLDVGVPDLRLMFRELRQDGPVIGTSTDDQVVDLLRAEGLRAGDRVGFVFESFHGPWACLGRFRVVAQIPVKEAPAYWNLDGSQAKKLDLGMRDQGIIAMIAKDAPRDPGPAWRRLQDTGFWFRRLD